MNNKEKQKNNSGRPVSYKEMFLNNDFKVGEFLNLLFENEKVMVSVLGFSGKLQLGTFKLVEMKGYNQVAGKSGKVSKLKPFKRVKFEPSKDFKNFLRNNT